MRHTLAALAVVLGLTAGLATPTAATVSHEPGYPNALAVCQWIDAEMERQLGQPAFPTRWRQFHYGTKHVTQCEMQGIYDPSWWAECFQHVEGDPRVYYFIGPFLGKCW